MRALLSVSDKTDLETLARGLSDRGYELVSTGGTARRLLEVGLAVTAVADVTGVPELMDGRVKTLHPAIHGGILARRDHPGDRRALEQQRIQPIDVVVVNLYPFARTAAHSDTTFDDLIEEIDIGGPTLVRAAAKNFRHVLVLVDPTDYEEALRELDGADGPQMAFRFRLATKAFAHTADYDDTIATTLDTVTVDGAVFERVSPPGPQVVTDRLRVALPRIRTLRYGENPHQDAAWYAEGSGSGFGAAQVLQGKELSFTNLLDLDAAARLVLEFDEPAAAIMKHTNPCGVGVASSIGDAYRRAHATDPLSAFGGIVGVNRAINGDIAAAITSTFIEAVVAPAIDEDARRILAAKKALRVLLVDLARLQVDGAGRREVRSILGAWLVQRRDQVDEARSSWEPSAGGDAPRVVTKRFPTPAEWRALRFAWRVCAHVKSNAVVFTRSDRTAAIGAGQTSRVDAVKVATMKATGSLDGTVAASDAFFPFRDGLDAVADAGATAVIQPGGSVRDAEVIAAADERGLAMVFTGRRHFWH